MGICCFVHSIVIFQYSVRSSLPDTYILWCFGNTFSYRKFIYCFNQNPIPGFYLNYSDLSGYGHSLIPYFIYKAYWFLLGIFIFTITFLFLKRGLYHSLRERFVTATG
ncbi:MAG: hypothetical protein IPI04_18355 [Ignavibacteria bacterium]|nr:hypothetical protein [Ignavibacteria bacterium]